MVTTFNYLSALDGYLSALRRQCVRHCFFGAMEFSINSSLEKTINLYVEEMKRRYAEMGEEYSYIGSEKLSYQDFQKVFDEYLYQNLKIQESEYFKLIEHDIMDYLEFASEPKKASTKDVIFGNGALKILSQCSKYEADCTLVLPLGKKTAIFIGLSIAP